MLEYSLYEINKLVKGKLIGDGANRFQNILTDSRQLFSSAQPLFLAIAGERRNGHIYIQDLYNKGVRCFIISEEPKNPEEFHNAGFVLVQDTLLAFQKIAEFHRSRFSIPIIAITGSNGKTIVKEWLAQCMENKHNLVRSPKSYNSQLGVPLSVLLLNNETETGIFEAGISKPGEMEKLEPIICPTQGIITNIGEAHQQNFSSFKEKAEEKITLFKKCKEIYYCSDYSEIQQAIDDMFKNSDKKLFSWSYNDINARLHIEILEKSRKETKVRLTGPSESLELVIPFIDNASIENCLHIINYLINNKFSSAEINNCLKTLHPIAMRLEQVKGINNCILINDTYNSDINSLGIALDFLLQQPNNKKSLILSDIQQSGMNDNELYGKVAELVKKSEIDSFIGIGDSIKKFERNFSFLNSLFFHTTEEFLNSDIVYSFNSEAILIKAARSFRFEKIVSILSEKNHTTVLEINLSNLIQNLNYYRKLISPKTGIMVMVKALAYGSGTYEIASLLQHEKVDYLGVAFTDEGVQLRHSGINIPIMVMSPDNEDFPRLINNDLEPEIYSLNTLKNFIRVAETMQVAQHPVHLKMDTGMHRLGFQESDIAELIQILQSTRTISVKGVFSHLAASDSPTHDDFSRKQISMFEKMYNQISNALSISPKRHILNTAGIERFPEAHFELVRLGIGLHGISTQSDLLPVSSLKTHISQIKKIPSGETIGYNRRGKAYKKMEIAIIPIGYADGLDRKFGNGTGQVIINNKKAPFVGDICMDMSMIDISDISCQEGDEVTLFSSEHPITLLAEQIDTIPYEILTNVSSRVKRVYIKE